MQLNGIAQKVKFKGLKEMANTFMESIAKKKGLKKSELEDRVIPDCGLDEEGKREFDFGPRKFQFVLGPDLKPMVKDEDGKIKDDLPKPNSKDDADSANASVEEWKLMKNKSVKSARSKRREWNRPWLPEEDGRRKNGRC
ncbi:hypothetical protein LEP1GSC171_3069 [Leptospira santarosai str. HAI1380]|nr:hypothetical protein LEP1GSC171_3069 [Leptospira santarosai str. HAI1380]